MLPTQYDSYRSQVFTEVPIVEKTGSSEGQSVKNFPAIKLRLLENVYVRSNRRFSVILKDGELLLPERWERAPYDLGTAGKSQMSGVPAYKWGDFLLFPKGGEKRSVEEALFIGTRAPDNYYHWLINGLLQLFVANTSNDLPKDVPVIVPERVKLIPQLMQSLKVVLKQRPLVFLKDQDVLSTKRLWVVDPPPAYDTPLSMDVKQRGPLPFHEQALYDFRRMILSNYEIDKEVTDASKRLFLIRPSKAARSEHQDLLLDIAQGYGYQPFRPEAHSFEDQVRQFATASRIIGPSGAGFTNLLFAPTNSRSLIWKPEFLPRENFFANLAGISGGVVFSLSRSTENSGGIQPDALDSFKRALISLE